MSFMMANFLVIVVYYLLVYFLVVQSYKRYGESMPLFRAVLVVICSAIPILNFGIVIAMIICIAVEGSGPTLEDVRLWFIRAWNKVTAKSTKVK